jgi:hypothetical protein
VLWCTGKAYRWDNLLSKGYTGYLRVYPVVQEKHIQRRMTIRRRNGGGGEEGKEEEMGDKRENII